MFRILKILLNGVHPHISTFKSMFFSVICELCFVDYHNSKTRHESWFWGVQQVHFPFMPKSKKVGHKSIAFACTSPLRLASRLPSHLLSFSDRERSPNAQSTILSFPWTPASIPVIVVKIDLPNHAEKLSQNISVF